MSTHVRSSIYQPEIGSQVHKKVRENNLAIMSKENDMHIFRPWKKNLKSFKKVELKSEYLCADPEGWQGVQTHPLKNHKLFGFF